MKTLIYGAGPLGSLYAYLLHKAGNDVTLLARNKRFDFIQQNGLVLMNEYFGEKSAADVKVTDKLDENDDYDLVVVLIRKNQILSIMPVLGRNQNIKHILFMGNNTLGFDEYLKYLPEEKMLFGFPGGGGSVIEQVVHYVDSEKPGGKRLPITIGEIDGELKDRTRKIRELFESAGVPVIIEKDIDLWLKYHIALVGPMAGAVYMSGNLRKLSADSEAIRVIKECADVLRELGYVKRRPSKLNMIYHFPEWLTAAIMKKIFSTKFMEIAVGLHAKAAADEMQVLADEFKTLVDKTDVKTPNIDKLNSFIP